MKPRTLFIFAAVGAAAALLLSTKKGKRLTNDLLDNADGLRGDLNRFTNKASGQLSDLTDFVGREVSGLVEDARKRISEMASEGSERMRKNKAY